MNIAAIICEYNPFHNGHLYHLNQTKEMLGGDTAVICLMSGNFVQRGEPAFTDKWARAETAVRCGADLVIELPFCYAVNGAKQFATGAVNILNSLGLVDYLSFASESGNIGDLEDAVYEDETRLRKFLDRGFTYPRAMQESTGADDSVLNRPNNTLGVEYLRALRNTGSSIQPFTMKRKGNISSSAIREAFARGEDISRFVPENVKGFTGEIPYELVVQAILSKTAGELDALPSAGEGIGNRLKSEVRKYDSTQKFVDGVRQSRYTKARINRCICQALVGYAESSCVRVLAVGKRGGLIIRRLEKDGIDVVTNINRRKGVSEKEILATDIYNLITGRDLYSFSEYVRRPYVTSKL